MYGLNKLAERIKEINLAHGFTGVPSVVNNTEDAIHLIYAFALIDTEVSEAIEAVREGNIQALPEELADIIIRTLHIASVLGFDIDLAVTDKIKVNEDRPYKHNKLC